MNNEEATIRHGIRMAIAETAIETGLRASPAVGKLEDALILHIFAPSIRRSVKGYVKELEDDQRGA